MFGGKILRNCRMELHCIFPALSSGDRGRELGWRAQGRRFWPGGQAAAGVAKSWTFPARTFVQVLLPKLRTLIPSRSRREGDDFSFRPDLKEKQGFIPLSPWERVPEGRVRVVRPAQQNKPARGTCVKARSSPSFHQPRLRLTRETLSLERSGPKGGGRKPALRAGCALRRIDPETARRTRSAAPSSASCRIQTAAATRICWRFRARTPGSRGFEAGAARRLVKKARSGGQSCNVYRTHRRGTHCAIAHAQGP